MNPNQSTLFIVMRVFRIPANFFLNFLGSIKEVTKNKQMYLTDRGQAGSSTP